MKREADPLYYSPSSGTGSPEGFAYVWGLAWSGENRMGYSDPKIPNHGRTSNHVYLLIPVSVDAELARNMWQEHLKGAIIEAFNYNGYTLNQGNSLVRSTEAEALETKLKGVLDGSEGIRYYQQNLERVKAEAIARFLRPRIAIVASLTSEERVFKVPLSRVDELLPIQESEHLPREYFQSMFLARDLEALEVAGSELNIPVLVLAKEGEKARLRQFIMVSQGMVLPEREVEVPKDSIFVEVQGESDLSEFWNAFNTLRDEDPSDC